MICLTAMFSSDSEEPPETLFDNEVNISIPVKYEVGLQFSR